MHTNSKPHVPQVQNGLLSDYIQQSGPAPVTLLNPSPADFHPVNHSPGGDVSLWSAITVH